jgi:hypothetical protein
VEQLGHLLPGDGRTPEPGQPAGQAAEGALRQQHAAQADGQRAGRDGGAGGSAGRRAGSEGRHQRGQRQQQPQRGRTGEGRHRGRVHLARDLQVGLQRLVLVVVAPARALLRQPRAVADHALDQLVRQVQPHHRPAPQAADVAPRQPAGPCAPHGQRRQLRQRRRAERQHPGREGQLDQRHPHREAAVEDQRFQCLRFDHAAQQVADAELAHQLDVQPQRTGQQARLQHPAGAEREGRLQPAAGQPQRDHRGQQQQPGGQPAEIEPAGQRGMADQAPAGDLQRVEAGEHRQRCGRAVQQAGLGQLLPEAGGGRQTQHPARPDAFAGQALAQHRGAHLVAPLRRHARGFEQARDLGMVRRLSLPAHRVAQRVQADALWPQVRPQQPGPAARATQQQEETLAALVFERQHHRRGAAQQPRQVGHRSVDGHHLQPQLRARPVDPAARLGGGVAFVERRAQRRRAQRLRRGVAEAAVPRQHLQAFAQARDRPPQGADGLRAAFIDAGLRGG